MLSPQFAVGHCPVWNRVVFSILMLMPMWLVVLSACNIDFPEYAWAVALTVFFWARRAFVCKVPGT